MWIGCLNCCSLNRLWLFCSSFCPAWLLGVHIYAEDCSRRYLSSVCFRLCLQKCGRSLGVAICLKYLAHPSCGGSSSSSLVPKEMFTMLVAGTLLCFFIKSKSKLSCSTVAFIILRYRSSLSFDEWLEMGRPSVCGCLFLFLGVWAECLRRGYQNVICPVD